jgi:hypothetical protein
MKTGKQIVEESIVPKQIWAKPFADKFIPMIGNDAVEYMGEPKLLNTQDEAIEYAKDIKNRVLSNLI